MCEWRVCFFKYLFNYEWEMCGWRVFLSLSILIRKLSWKAKLIAKTWNSWICFVSHPSYCKDVFKIGFYPTLEDGTILSNFHCFNMNANMRRFKQLCSSNMLSTIDLLVWEPLKKRKQSCHMHFIFKLLHQCSNWSKANIHQARQLRWSKQLVLVKNYSHICVTRVENNFTLLILNWRMPLLMFWRFKKAFQSICHCNVVESKSL